VSKLTNGFQEKSSISLSILFVSESIKNSQQRVDVPSIHTLYRTLAKDTTVYFIATVGAKLASMAVIPLAAYILAAAQFAVYDEFLLINTLLTLLLLLGIDSAAAVKIPLTQDEDYHGHLLLFMLCVTSLAFAILLGIAASLTALGIWTSLPLWHSVFASFCSALQLIVFTFFRHKGGALHSALIMFVSAVLSTVVYCSRSCPISAITAERRSGGAIVGRNRQSVFDQRQNCVSSEFVG
jgi:O-antigen/teichoic acid export membrane protein